MPELSKKDIEIIFYKLVRNEINIREFEEWLYNAEEMEKYYSPEFYFDLVSLDYRDKFVKEKVEEIVYPKIPFSQLEKVRIMFLLQSIISKCGDLVEELEIMYDEYCDGYTFLRYIGLYYVSNYIDEIPKLSERSSWNENVFLEKRKALDKISSNIFIEAKRILGFLERDEIIITDVHVFQDNRKYEDQIEIHSYNNMYKKEQ